MALLLMYDVDAICLGLNVRTALYIPEIGEHIKSVAIYCIIKAAVNVMLLKV